MHSKLYETDHIFNAIKLTYFESWFFFVQLKTCANNIVRYTINTHIHTDMPSKILSILIVRSNYIDQLGFRRELEYNSFALKLIYVYTMNCMNCINYCIQWKKESYNNYLQISVYCVFILRRCWFKKIYS